MNEISTVKSQLRLQTWAAMVNKCQQSGMTIEAWCQNNGIKRKIYYYRLKKVREAALACIHKDQMPIVNEGNASCFAKLEVQSAASNSAAAIVIHLPQATLEVTNDASQRTLEAVFLALKATC